MSAPNPTVIEPATVYAKDIEVNGPANIITSINNSQRYGTPLDMKYLQHQAWLFSGYLDKLATGRKLKWHEHLAEANQPNRRKS